MDTRRRGAPSPRAAGSGGGGAARRKILRFALVLSLAMPASVALAGGVSEYPWKDWENGWSIKPLLGWETRPPSLPGDSKEVRIAAGWYPKGRDEKYDSSCVVIALGSYFEEALKAPGAGSDPPAPERFPKWVEGWLESLGKDVGGRAEGSGEPCRIGSDAGWRWEGEYRFKTHERSSLPPRESYDVTRIWQILAVGARRGDYEVGVVFMLFRNEWDAEVDLKPMRESALSLRFLDAKEMARKRDELEARAKRAGGEDEAWIARVRAKIPKGWRSLRRGDTVYVHPDGVPGSTVETMAARLDAMRKKAYAKLFPATMAPDAPPAVVKITLDKRQYLSYGAPEGSLGYFSAGQRELVLFYQARDWWDRIDSTAVLFHEGFHQYVNQALDGLAAHPWFEEGLGDYFAGWRLYEGNPRPGELAARRARMDEIYDREAWVPVGDLLRMEWGAFYGKGEEAADPAVTYPQSWSLVTFLRSGKHSECLDRYFAALREGVRKWKEKEAAAAAREGRQARSAGEMAPGEAERLREAALAAGFPGVDFGDLEQEWLDWIYKR